MFKIENYFFVFFILIVAACSEDRPKTDLSQGKQSKPTVSQLTLENKPSDLETKKKHEIEKNKKKIKKGSENTRNMRRAKNRKNSTVMDVNEKTAASKSPVSTRNMTFSNPIVTTKGAHPKLTYHNGYYYLALTTQTSKLYFKKAKTIEALKVAPLVEVWDGQSDVKGQAACCGIQSYELQSFVNKKNETRWYFRYAAGPANSFGDKRFFVLESESSDPMGPYHYKGQFQSTLDQDIFGKNGTYLILKNKYYFIYSRTDTDRVHRIYIAPMSNPWRISGQSEILSEPEFAWEKQRNQSPVSIQNNDKTFVTYSVNDCSRSAYKLGMLSYNGGEPLNKSSWIKSVEPIFHHIKGRKSHAVNAHHFFKSPDGTQTWMAYTMNEEAEKFRGCGQSWTTRIQKLAWNKNGAPKVEVPLSLLKQVRKPSGDLSNSQTFEAESASIKRAQAFSSRTAFNGAKVAHIDYEGSWVEFNVVVRAAGAYRLNVRYSNGLGGGKSEHRVIVNQDKPLKLIYPDTKGWDNFKVASIKVKLKAGKNTIRLAKGSKYAELDNITVLPIVGYNEYFEAESAELTKVSNRSSTKASGGKKVSRISNKNSAVEFRAQVEKAGTYWMNVRYSNGVANRLIESTHFVSVNEGEETQLVYPITGGWELFSHVEMEVNLNAGENTIRFTKGAHLAELDYILLSERIPELTELILKKQ